MSQDERSDKKNDEKNQAGGEPRTLEGEARAGFPAKKFPVPWEMILVQAVLN
jgi:hypothetical protein